jgi:hypothetical protein
MEPVDSAARDSRTLTDMTLVILLLTTICLLISAALDATRIEGELSIVKAEARDLEQAFKQFYERNGGYPNVWGEPRFEPDTLEPLRERGYYDGTIAGKLVGQRIDAYDSPDDQGLNQEFWLEMTVKSDPTIRLLIADSDDAPLGGGKWHRGVFVHRDGALEAL